MNSSHFISHPDSIDSFQFLNQFSNDPWIFFTSSPEVRQLGLDSSVYSTLQSIFRKNSL